MKFLMKHMYTRKRICIHIRFRTRPNEPLL